MQEDEFEVDAEASENRGRQAAGDEDVADIDDRAEAKVKRAKDELAEAKAEAKTNLDGWQRAKADYVNLLKRSEGDVKSAKDAGVTKAVEALLPAYDAIERAKEHGDIPDGFAAIVKQLEAAFGTLGLVPVGEVGEAFDPNLHEAYGQDAVEDKSKDDTITAVLEKGWKQGERVIRPAKVRVAHYE